MTLEGLKEWGKICWSVLGCLLLLLLFMGFMYFGAYANAEARVRGHFEKEHGIKCEH